MEYEVSAELAIPQFGNLKKKECKEGEGSAEISGHEIALQHESNSQIGASECRAG